jgi:SynChlorMet cassette protein ScmC
VAASDNQRSQSHACIESLNALSLADGSVIAVVAAGSGAQHVVQGLTATMGLRRSPAATRTVIVSAHECEVATGGDPDAIVCALGPNLALAPVFQYHQVALVIAHDAESRGGLLLHGALAARDNAGVILAGPSGIGKSTASRRLRPPWRSLCDDTTLVVRDARGRCFAHPWPTWSNFYEDAPKKSWNVADAVPLRAVCFLSQAAHEHVDRVRPGEAAGLLFESARQIGRNTSRDRSSIRLREKHLRLFDRACGFASAVPCFALQLSLDGSFWRELDRIVDAPVPE